MRVAALHRYPVKGLSPEPLREAMLKPGGWFAGDRLFAIENGPSGFDPAAPQHLPKLKFLMLMRHAQLARLKTRYDDRSEKLSIHLDGAEVAYGDLGTEGGRSAIESFLADFMGSQTRGRLRLIAAPGNHRFTDSRSGFVSLVNLASVAAIEARVDRPLDPLRLRANIQLEGLPAWAEWDMVGRRLAFPGGVVLEITKRIDRCAAIDVDPQTGIRDLDLVATLLRGWGHNDCGVYARVVRGGTIRSGDHPQLDDAAGGEAQSPRGFGHGLL